LLSIGGDSILHKYNCSPALLLSTVYSEYEWLPWKFDISPQNYWGNVNNRKKFMEWAAQQLNIKDMADWYKVSQKVPNTKNSS
jgi:hypothetical protein